MTIDLPSELEQFIHEQVQAGRFPSEQDLVRTALEQLRSRTPRPSPGPGMIGALREDAELLDEIVEHAMKVREARSSWMNAGE